jgi:hypothetical protein
MLLTTEQYLTATYNPLTRGDKTELYNLTDLLKSTDVLYSHYEPLALKILTNKENIEFSWATDEEGNPTDYKVLSRVVSKIILKWGDKFRVSKFYFFPQDYKKYGNTRQSFSIGNGIYCDSLEDAHRVYKNLTH